MHSTLKGMVGKHHTFILKVISIDYL